jgi:kanamycin nucleotidyltransferase
MIGLPPMPLEGAVQDVLDGPAPLGRADRELVAEAIVRRLLNAHGEAVIAIALYGSCATGLDGPFSDIELWAALDDAANGPGWRSDAEWVWGAGKAETNLFSEQVLRARAGVVHERWSLTHGKFVHAAPLFERQPGFVDEIRRVALALPVDAVREAISASIVGELYEQLGKLRNAAQMSRAGEGGRHYLHLAEQASLLTALAQGYCFRSGSTFLEEAAGLKGPMGFADLIMIARRGALSDVGRLLAAAEDYWAGLARWIEALNLDLSARCKAGF